MTGSFYFPLILPNNGRIINMQAEIDIFVVLVHRWLGGALSLTNAVMRCLYNFFYERRVIDSMEQFFVDVLKRIVGSVLATYTVRFFDKITNKNDRHSPKHGH